MTTFDFAALADQILPVVLAAGAVEMRFYESGVAVDQKADLSPVTAADHASEAILVEGLSRVAEGIPIVAEESVSLGKVPPKAGVYFVVDPLDGTREFTSRRDEFTINIGLVVGHLPVFGMIYAPALGELFVTLDARRAVETRIAPDQPVAGLAACTLRELRTREPDAAGLTVLESRSHRSAEIDAFLAGYAISEIKRSGSALKFCRLARGDADLYVRLGPTSEWDTVAGHAILEAAGGSVTTLSGAPLTYGKDEGTYLNPHFIAWGREPIAPRTLANSSI